MIHLLFKMAHTLALGTWVWLDMTVAGAHDSTRGLDIVEEIQTPEDRINHTSDPRRGKSRQKKGLLTRRKVVWNSLKHEHKMARVCTKMWNESTHLVIPSMKDWNNDSGLLQRETTKGHCHSWWSLGKYQTGTGTWVLTICDFFASGQKMLTRYPLVLEHI